MKALLSWFSAILVVLLMIAPAHAQQLAWKKEFHRVDTIAPDGTGGCVAIVKPTEADPYKVIWLTKKGAVKAEAEMPPEFETHVASLTMISASRFYIYFENSDETFLRRYEVQKKGGFKISDTALGAAEGLVASNSGLSPLDNAKDTTGFYISGWADGVANIRRYNH